MKTYQIMKIVKAKSLKEAMRLERTVDFESIITIDNDAKEGEDDKLDNEKVYGFGNKKR